MTKNDNAHSVRLTESLKRNVGAGAAGEFAAQYPLSKSANVDKKYEWARNACQYLERNFDVDTIVRIRKDCSCNDGKSIANKLSKYLRSASSIEEFVDKFNESETFAQMEYKADRHILFCYPVCYCACVKRVPQELSRTWCYCTLGNAEGIFSRVFQKDVEVTLVQSIKTGADRCIIDVKW